MSFKRSFIYGMAAGASYGAFTQPIGCALLLLIAAVVVLVLVIAFWKVLVVLGLFGAGLIMLNAVRASRRSKY